MNSVCQGSAADLIKLAMVNIFHQFSSEPSFSNVRRARTNGGAGFYRVQDDEVRFLLQVHDELLFEVREDCVKTVTQIVRSCMEEAVQLRVPLKVKVKVGKNWGSLQELK